MTSSSRSRAALGSPMGRHRRPAKSNVAALIPAHDEAHQIAQCIAAVRDQVDRVVVVADNCSDGTEAVARAEGAEVVVTVGNRAKKAGALNQALGQLLPTLRGADCVLVVDADS